MHVVLIHSGGLDSSVLLASMLDRKYEVDCLSFEYGSKHAHKEMSAALDVCIYYRVPRNVVELPLGQLFVSNLLSTGGDIPEGDYKEVSMKQTVVPFRNAIMLSIAAGYAESIGAEAVAIGAHAGDHYIYPDCRPAFLHSMGEAMIQGTEKNIRLFSPFQDMTKGDIVTLGSQLHVPFELTWTCYKGHEIHCGVCGSCNERKQAFADARVADPVRYEK